MPGQVRARRIRCSDEILPSGEARQGDWLLENALIRIAIRDATVSLTQLEGTGGTVLDVALPGGTDALVELIPRIDGEWMESASIEAWESNDSAGIVVTGLLPGGSKAQVGYTLGVDSSELLLSGMTGITLVPMTNSTLKGEALETPIDGDWILFAPDTEPDDLGGWLQWSEPSRMVLGTRHQVNQQRWPEGRLITGTSDGDWVVLLEDGQTTARYPVDDGQFEAWVPAEADGIQCIGSGHEPSPVMGLRSGHHLALGEQGRVVLSVTDQDGALLPASLTWNDIAYPWLPGDGPIDIGPGPGEGLISAGPAYNTVAVPSQELSGTLTIEVQLTRQIGEAMLARLDVVGAPDRTERRSSDRLLRAQAADGVRWAVLVAEDEIPRVSLEDSTSDWIQAQAGSVSGSRSGAPMSWPWSTDNDSPAHGATAWQELAPLDILDVMTRAGSRRAVVDANWVDAAGDPSDWGLRPEALRLNSMDELPVLTDLLDNWVPISPVGPWTWIEDVREDEASTTEAVRGILAGRTTATTGPRLLLRVNGTPPGELLPEGPMPEKAVQLQVEAAPGFEPTHAAIVTDEGELERWELSQPGPQLLRAQTIAYEPAWVIAIAWTEGQEGPWAISSPVWVGRP
jgi:hypothetical protein